MLEFPPVLILAQRSAATIGSHCDTTQRKTSPPNTDIKMEAVAEAQAALDEGDDERLRSLLKDLAASPVLVQFAAALPTPTLEALVLRCSAASDAAPATRHRVALLLTIARNAHQELFSQLAPRAAVIGAALLGGCADEAASVAASGALQALLGNDAFSAALWAAENVPPALGAAGGVGVVGSEAEAGAADGAPLLLARLGPLLTSPSCRLCSEAWQCLNAAIQTFPAAASACLAGPRQFRPFVLAGLRCLSEETGHYVSRRFFLRLLTSLVTDAEHAPLRKRLLQSPALLCAVLECFRDPSPHISFEAFHSLKVFVVKPTKCPAVRHVLLTNQRLLAELVHAYAADEAEARSRAGGGGPAGSQGDDIAAEVALVLVHLANVPPLTPGEQTMLLVE